MTSGYLTVELTGLLEAQTLHEVHKHGFLHLYLAILELTLQRLLGKKAFRLLRLTQRQTDLRLGTASLDNVHPLLLRLLIGLRHDFHLVATLQLMADGDYLIINARAHALVANLGVDVISKIEHRGSFGELIKVTLRREDKHLVLVEFHLELVHGLHA